MSHNRIIKRVKYLAKTIGPVKLVGEFPIRLRPTGVVHAQNPWFMYNSNTHELSVHYNINTTDGLTKDLIGIVKTRD